tara:strand:- start:4458 stop:5393 length:936 start_codon:yes stop_codon:yes gene_type:complete
MKKIYTVLTLILLLATNSTFAQDFAPVGAKWVYTIDYAFSFDIGFVTIESISDTVIQGKTCQEVVAPEGHQALSGGTKFLHTNNDTLFIYDTTTQAFSPFQIFNAQAGDEWDFVYTPASLGMTPSIDTLHYIVDSVGIEIINTDTLKKVYASSILSCAGWSINDTTKIVYLERLGDLYYLFNYNNYGCNPAIDADVIGGLRCYSDPTFGSYETGIVDSCYWIYDPTSVAEINAENTVELWPNPVNNTLNIQVNTGLETLNIYNINGQLVKPINVSSTQNQLLTIDVADLPPGIYSLVGLSNQKTIKAKFVK